MKSKILEIGCMFLILMTVACSGEDGEPGPEGPQGEVGPAGEGGPKGEQGDKGNDANTYRFYFQRNHKGYTGVSDAIISEDQPDKNFGTIPFYSFDRLDGAHNYLIQFDSLDKYVKAEVGEQEFYVNEAVLYYHWDTEGEASMRFYEILSHKFVEREVTYNSASEEAQWNTPGLVGGSDIDDSFLYTQRPGGLTGTIPVILPRSLIQKWINTPEANLGIANSFGVYVDGDIDNYFSEWTADHVKPMLYFDIEIANESGRKSDKSHSEYVQEWKQKSHQEQLEPYYQFINNRN